MAPWIYVCVPAESTVKPVVSWFMLGLESGTDLLNNPHRMNSAGEMGEKGTQNPVFPCLQVPPPSQPVLEETRNKARRWSQSPAQSRALGPEGVAISSPLFLTPFLSEAVLNMLVGKILTENMSESPLPARASRYGVTRL